MIVVDASSVVEILLHRPYADAVASRLFDFDEPLHAAHLVDSEVAHALRRYALSGELSADQGRMLIGTLGDLPIRRYPHRELLPRIWELRWNFAACDASYVALAELLGASLLTLDRRLAAAAASHVRVERL